MELVQGDSRGTGRAHEECSRMREREMRGRNGLQASKSKEGSGM